MVLLECDEPCTRNCNGLSFTPLSTCLRYTHSLTLPLWVQYSSATILPPVPAAAFAPRAKVTPSSSAIVSSQPLRPVCSANFISFLRILTNAWSSLLPAPPVDGSGPAPTKLHPTSFAGGSLIRSSIRYFPTDFSNRRMLVLLAAAIPGIRLWH